MVRLIDADKLKNYLCSEPLYSDPLNERAYIREHIDKMPTVDAVPVIRCKDCKYYEPYDCGLHTGTWFPESYCDMAERKEE